MRTRLVVSCALLMACPPAPGGDTDGGPTTSPATTTSSATGPTTTTETTGTSTAPTTSGPGPTSTTGDPCPVGAAGCACTAGGACDPGLVCEAGACAEGCAVGSLGCPCTGGGGCDAGLTCDAGECVEGISPPCMPMGGLEVGCCGNGWTEPLEECDEGGFNGDAASCTPKCKHAVCGDGFVFDQVEACDGGEECSAICTFKSCGNGTVEPWEWCEPRGGGDPECTDLCGDARKIIFVSSVHYKGGEIGSIQGGLLGADGRCQELAVNAGLKGDFKAWLATSPEDAPLVRFSWLAVPYVDVNGDVIATTWSEIYNKHGTPPPRVTELGTITTDSEITWQWMVPVVTNRVAWASTLYGDIVDPDNPRTCGGWDDTSEQGTVALLDHNPDIPNGASQKFNVGMSASCDKAAPIVCVEQ